jgi:hypothetical protein
MVRSFFGFDTVRVGYTLPDIDAKGFECTFHGVELTIRSRDRRHFKPFSGEISSQPADLSSAETPARMV